MPRPHKVTNFLSSQNLHRLHHGYECVCYVSSYERNLGVRRKDLLHRKIPYTLQIEIINVRVINIIGGLHCAFSSGAYGVVWIFW